MNVNMQHDPQDFLPAYEQLLAERNIPPGARPHYLQCAKIWSTTVRSDDKSATEAFFQELCRRPNLTAWQFQQAVRAVAWLARDILHIPWTQTFDWRGLADQADPLETDHRTLGRETIRVSAKVSAPPRTSPLPKTREEAARKP